MRIDQLYGNLDSPYVYRYFSNKLKIIIQNISILQFKFQIYIFKIFSKKFGNYKQLNSIFFLKKDKNVYQYFVEKLFLEF